MATSVLFSDPFAVRDVKAAAPRSAVERAGEDCLRDRMVAYQQGDPAAVDKLVDALSPMLARYLASSYVSQADAEDLLQDCWLRIHRARHTYPRASRCCRGFSRLPGTHAWTRTASAVVWERAKY